MFFAVNCKLWSLDCELVSQDSYCKLSTVNSFSTFLGAELLHGAGKAKPRFTTELTEVTEKSSPVCLRVLRALCGEWLFGGLPGQPLAG
jgi:hypothetical protein